MTDHSASQFDFDDWAELYKDNPQEFEIRRSAALMFEVARGSSKQRTDAYAMLESFERRAEGCDTQQRLKLSASMMTDSLGELSTELMMLRLAIQNLTKDNQERSEPVQKQK